MHIFEEGRKAFLEFLRNLTPQIVLLALAFAVGSRINFSKFDLGNVPTTVFFFALIALAIAGMAANSINFLSEYCISLEKLDNAIKAKLGPDRVAIFCWAGIVLAEAWKLKRRLAVEIVVALVAINTVMLGVVIGAMFQGAGFLKNIH